LGDLRTQGNVRDAFAQGTQPLRGMRGLTLSIGGDPHAKTQATDAASVVTSTQRQPLLTLDRRASLHIRNQPSGTQLAHTWRTSHSDSRDH
jgi:hypothetical protein